MHKDGLQARSLPSTTPHFVRVNKATIVTKHLFLRGQPNRKLRDRQLGPFTIEEHIGRQIYKSNSSAIIRLHPVFTVNNLRPCSTTSLRLDVPSTTPKEDDEEFDVSHISVVRIKSLHGRRGKHLLYLMTYISNNDIPHGTG
jgi:hypothetical protein